MADLDQKTESAAGKPETPASKPASEPKPNSEPKPKPDVFDEGSIRIGWKTCLRVAISAIIVFLVIRYWNIAENFIGLLLGGLLAVFAGLVIAYIINIPLRFFERKLPGETGDGTRNRTLSIICSVTCIVVALLVVGILVIPNLVEAIIVLAQAAPGVIDTITENEFISSLIPAQFLAQLKTIDWSSVVSDAADWLRAGVVSSLPQITNLLGSIGAWFMGIILAFWFVGEKDRLSQGVHAVVRSYLGTRADDNFRRAIDVADECFHGYIVGAVTEGLIFGTIVTVACAIAGIPNPLMLGALVGVMSLIPMVGALIGAVLGAIIILATSWQKALIFLVLFFVVQQIEANFIYPRVVGKHVGLTGMWPLIGITLGVALFGFVGAFVGVPLTATIFRIVESDIKRREKDEKGLTPLERLQRSLAD